MKKQGGFKLLAGLLAVLLGGLVFAALLGLRSGSNTGESAVGYKEYDSLSSLKRAINIEFEIPQFIEQQDDLKFRSYYGQMIEISNQNFEFRAAYFIDNMADVFGIYSDSEVDESYSVETEDSSVIFVRYRTGIEDQPDISIFNWNDGEVQYGLMTGSGSTLEQYLACVGLSKEDLGEYTQESEDDTEPTGNGAEDAKEYVKYTDEVSGISFYMPQMNEQVYLVYNDEQETLNIYIDGKILIIISKNVGNYDSEGEYISNESEGAYIMYSSDKIGEYGLTAEDIEVINVTLDMGTD